MERLEQVLQTMERRLPSVGPVERAHILSLAGDLCIDAGQRKRALPYYAGAVDQYLIATRHEAAAAVCRRIIHFTPSVVRARCTLSWLALQKADSQEAAKRIPDYAHAAADADQHRLARGHLRMMTEFAQPREVLEVIAEGLLELGDHRGADRAWGVAFGHDLPDRKLPPDPRLSWELVLERIVNRETAAAPAATAPPATTEAASWSNPPQGLVLRIGLDADPFDPSPLYSFGDPVVPEYDPTEVSTMPFGLLSFYYPRVRWPDVG